MASKSHDERENQSLLDLAATTSQDLYGLLLIPNPFLDTDDGAPREISKSELSSAWKKAALKWHPDKNPGNEATAAAKLDECRKAYEVLTDPVAKHRYDDKQRAKRQWELRHRKMDERRRKFAEDLERQEDAAFGKRKREETDEERRTQWLEEKARLARMAKMEQRRRDAEEAEVRRQEYEAQKKQAEQKAAEDRNGSTLASDEAAPEQDRTVKVRWISWAEANGNDGAVGARPSAAFQSHIKALFSHFGGIEEVLFIGDKMLRPAPKKDSEAEGAKKPKKRLMSTAGVVYKSVVSAWDAKYNAGNKGDAKDWKGFDSCEWWSGSAPKIGSSTSTNGVDRPHPEEHKPAPSSSFKSTAASAPLQEPRGDVNIDEPESTEPKPKPAFSFKSPDANGGKSRWRQSELDEEQDRARERQAEIDRILKEEEAEEAAAAAEMDTRT